MIAKEWRTVRWKLIVAAVGVMPALLMLAAYLPPYETAGRIVERFSDKTALEQILNVYEGGGIALGMLAILLGGTAISEEAGKGTVYLLLSKPISRTRLLLTTYGVSAGILLSAAVVGHAVLILASAARGYPWNLLNAQGVVLSTALVWIWSLSILGLALLFSIAFGSTLVSLMTTFVVTCLGIYLLPGLLGLAVPYQTLEQVAPLYSWTSVPLYVGKGLALPNFLTCTTAAVAMLVAPLWLFQRKAY